MPVTYHYRTRSPDSIDELLSYPLEPFSDDSIVLSDILRTGETSRLRRRGAMRIESSRPPPPLPHQYRLRSVQQAGSSPVSSIMQDLNWSPPGSRSRLSSRHPSMLEVCGDSEDDGFDPDSGDEITFSASFNQAISEQTGVHHSGARIASRDHISTEKAFYTLVCGGLDDSAFCKRGTPGTNYPSFLAASILPQPLHSASQGPMPASGSNGCGAIIHTKAFPRYYHHRPIWGADTPPTDTVVPLDAAYFDDFCEKEKLSMKLIRRENCGCFRIGIGCAQCGNRLGFRLRPCQKLKDGLYPRSQTQNLRSSITPKSKQEQKIYLYTFFSTSTMSPETTTFPAAESTPRSSRPRIFPDTPILPPPPPMIRIMSDSDLSDSDEDIAIDFGRSESTSGSTPILGGNLTASPEPQTLDLGQTDVTPRINMSYRLPGEAVQVSNNEIHGLQSSIETNAASFSNDDRGPENTISPEADGSYTPNQVPRFRVPVRRRALSPNAASFLGSIPLIAQSDQIGSTSPITEISIPIPTSSMSSAREIEPSMLETSNDMSSPAIWGMSIADGHPSTSFWGRPPDGTVWTWANTVGINNEDGRSERYDNTRPRFDPDGEFLEALGREWGEDLARELGLEEKSESGETLRGQSDGSWW